MRDMAKTYLGFAIASGYNPFETVTKTQSYKVCPQCGNNFTNRGKICFNCFSKNGNSLEPASDSVQQPLSGSPEVSPEFDLQCTKCGRKWNCSDMQGYACCGQYAQAL